MKMRGIATLDCFFQFMSLRQVSAIIIIRNDSTSSTPTTREDNDGYHTPLNL